MESEGGEGGSYRKDDDWKKRVKFTSFDSSENDLRRISKAIECLRDRRCESRDVGGVKEGPCVRTAIADICELTIILSLSPLFS